jgi:hypothetical protein
VRASSSQPAKVRSQTSSFPPSNRNRSHSWRTTCIPTTSAASSLARWNRSAKAHHLASPPACTSGVDRCPGTSPTASAGNPALPDHTPPGGIHACSNSALNRSQHSWHPRPAACSPPLRPRESTASMCRSDPCWRRSQPLAPLGSGPTTSHRSFDSSWKPRGVAACSTRPGS